MTIPEVDKWKAQTGLARKIYYRNWSHLIYPLFMSAPFVLWGFGYIFTDIKEAFFLSLTVCVVYEIHCLRGDIQYYGEIWRRDLKAKD